MAAQRNAEIREAIKSANIYTYEISESLGIHETTFYRMMRKELTKDKKDKILAIIKTLSEESKQDE